MPFDFNFQYFQRSARMGDVNRRLKSQIWSSVVTIVLVEGKNLQPMDIDGFSDPYIKFRCVTWFTLVLGKSNKGLSANK